jgi:hypothetical protein
MVTNAGNVPSTHRSSFFGGLIVPNTLQVAKGFTAGIIPAGNGST